jgi:NADH:ubiquinone oxidoreductase subunit C
MKAVLVFIDGIICDYRQSEHLSGTPDYIKRDVILKDAPTPDSRRGLHELATRYNLVYMAARPEEARKATEDWLAATNYPQGPLFLGITPADRLALAPTLLNQFEFEGGLGTHWEDNELHLELGCKSIILKEFEVDWEIVRRYLLGQEHTALHVAIDLLTPRALKITEPAVHRVDAYLDAGRLLPAVKSLHDARWGYLSAITGLDDVQANEIEVLYHFCNRAAVATLRVRISRDKAAIPSICSIKAGATFFERELSEMFGIEVLGTPNTDRLFLPDEWPPDVYPLRKDFTVPAPVEN